jgi:hypothetical protein
MTFGAKHSICGRTANIAGFPYFKLWHFELLRVLPICSDIVGALVLATTCSDLCRPQLI